MAAPAPISIELVHVSLSDGRQLHVNPVAICHVAKEGESTNKDQKSRAWHMNKAGVLVLEDGRQLYAMQQGEEGVAQVAKEGEMFNKDVKLRTWTKDGAGVLSLADGRQLYAKADGGVCVAKAGEQTNTDAARRTWTFDDCTPGAKRPRTEPEGPEFTITIKLPKGHTSDGLQGSKWGFNNILVFDDKGNKMEISSSSTGERGNLDMMTAVWLDKDKDETFWAKVSGKVGTIACATQLAKNLDVTVQVASVQRFFKDIEAVHWSNGEFRDGTEWKAETSKPDHFREWAYTVMELGPPQSSRLSPFSGILKKTK